MKNRSWGLFYAALIIPQGHPDIEINNFNLVESDSSIRSLEIQAQKAQMFQEEQIGLLHIVKAKVWSVQNSIYEIQSKIAAINTATQDFQTEGDTSIVTPDAYSLVSKNVFYSAKNKTLTSSENVSVEPISKEMIKDIQDFKLTGVGLSVFLKSDVFRVEKNVRASQNFDKNKKLEITSKKFEFDSLSNSGRFLTQVSVKHPEYVMSGDNLFLQFKKTADGQSWLNEMDLKSANPKNKVRAKINGTDFIANGLKLFFDKESNIESSEALGKAEALLEDGIILKADRLYSFTEKGIQKIKMTDDVYIQTSTRNATCGEALFIPSTGDFILEKVATLKEADQIIEGDKIFFSTAHNKLRVEKASGNLGKERLKKLSN